MDEDRLINDKKIEYIKKVAGCIRSSFENLEQKLLEKDWDISIKFDEFIFFKIFFIWGLVQPQYLYINIC